MFNGKQFNEESGDGGSLDPTKINGLAKAETSGWTNYATDTDINYQVANGIWSQNSTLLETVDDKITSRFTFNDSIVDEKELITLTNDSVTFVTGRGGRKCAYFDGSAKLTGLKAKQMTDFLITLWVKPIALSSKLFDIHDDTAYSNCQVSLYATSNPRVGLSIANTVPDYPVDIYTPTATAQIGSWQHLAFLLNGTTANVYINGEIAGTDTLTGTVRTATKIVIGNRQLLDNAFNGYLQDLCIREDTGLSIAESLAIIEAEYNNGIGVVKLR